MGAAENAGDVGVVELRAGRECVATLVQPFRDGAGAHRAVPVADRRQSEHQSNGTSIVFMNEKFLLGLRAAHLDCAAFIAKRHGATVVEPILGVCPHGPTSMLGGLQRKIFVKRSDKVAEHPAHRVVGEILGQGEQANFRALETREGLHLRFHVTSKARQREDLDFANAVGRVLDKFKHPVELRAPGILATFARIHEDPRPAP
ncbi:MAG: hypothetical protein M3R41_03410 [Pseudomonadota bacterium]|nr:hypothetical protein [Pseudomonadota bacterium]